MDCRGFLGSYLSSDGLLFVDKLVFDDWQKTTAPSRYSTWASENGKDEIGSGSVAGTGIYYSYEHNNRKTIIRDIYIEGKLKIEEIATVDKYGRIAQIARSPDDWVESCDEMQRRIELLEDASR